MKYLVTGATGFLGLHMTKALIAQHKDVRVFVRNTSNVLPLQRLNVGLVYGDLRDEASVRNAADSVDVVFHCAGAVGDWGAHSTFQDTNVEGTKNLLKACQRAGVTRVVVFSSLAVYGIKNHEGTREGAPIEKSGDGYADSKVETERVLEPFISEGRPELVILRPGIIYGPGDKRFVPKIVESLRNHRFVFVGDGTNVLNIVYIDDVVQAALLSVEKLKSSGRTYNLTDGTRTTLRQFVNQVAFLCGAPPPSRRIPYRLARAIVRVGEARARLFGGEPSLTGSALDRLVATRYFDIERARTELAFTPTVGYVEGLRRMFSGEPQAETVSKTEIPNSYRSEFKLLTPFDLYMAPACRST